MAIKSIPKIVAEAMPSVVSITISKHLKEIEKDLPHEYLPFLQPQYEKQRQALKSLADADGMVQIGGGSGFIVDAGGIVVTNRHVVSEPKAEYTVITNDDQKFDAEILARDPVSDVAVLKLHLRDDTKGKVKKLPVLSLGTATNVKLGEPIIAIGNSLGLFRNTVSSGIISGLSRSIRAQASPDAPLQEMRGLIQTDAAINPGNSGGPLLNESGQVIGINTAIVYGAQNIGFAIPIDTAGRDLDDLNKFGRIRRPLLGVRYITVDENFQTKANLSVDHGALIVSEDEHAPGVIPGSPGAKAGLRERDIILECDGLPINSQKTISDILSEKTADDILNLKVMRAGKVKTVKVKLTERK